MAMLVSYFLQLMMSEDCSILIVVVKLQVFFPYVLDGMNLGPLYTSLLV